MRSLRTPCVRRADPRPRPPAHTCRPLPQRCKRDTSLRPRLSSSPRPGHVSFRPQVPVSCIPVCDTPGCDCPSRLSGKGTYRRPPGPPPGPVRAPRGRCVSRPVDGAARQRGGVWDGRAGPRSLRVPEGRCSRPWEAVQRPVRLRVCSAVISHQLPLPPGPEPRGRGRVRPRQRSVPWPPRASLFCSTASLLPVHALRPGWGQRPGRPLWSPPRPARPVHTGDIIPSSLVGPPRCCVMPGLVLLTGPPRCEEGPHCVICS